jgi:NAD(P)-dependent dehydrogenase (short-subunit alcohol dehydrogenase family)
MILVQMILGRALAKLNSGRHYLLAILDRIWAAMEAGHERRRPFHRALGLSSDAIRINSVSPGWTWTGESMDKLIFTREVWYQVAAPFNMSGRAGNRREVVYAVLFLCSDFANWVNGADLAVDGAAIPR